jgi:hypothetical protein
MPNSIDDYEASSPLASNEVCVATEKAIATSTDF